MIKRLLYMNGLATIAVILFHASGWGFIAMFFWADQYRTVASPNFDLIGSLPYFALRVIEQIVSFGVPAFLFVSGFL
jgi:hypothetical protein